jgi:hypothetical protein
MLKIGSIIKVLFLSAIAVCFSTQLNASVSVSQPLFSFYQSEDNTQNLSDIVSKYRLGRFENLDGTFANFGRTERLYWLHFLLPGTENGPRQVLEVDNSHIYDIKVYQMENNSLPKLLYHTGINEIFEHRPYPARNFVFPINEIQGEQSHYFISIDRRKEVLNFNVRLVDEYGYTKAALTGFMDVLPLF